MPRNILNLNHANPGRGFALICLLACFVGCSSPAQQEEDRPRVRIGSAVWNVELATTNQQRYTGMANRAYLGPDAGMLFIYPDAAPRAYCMRDCVISLDIAFIDSDMKVVKIYTMPAEPGRAGNVAYQSYMPAQYVLEVAGGMLARHGVVEGIKVELLGKIPPAAKSEPGP
ncbi:MAG: DUF192 domain-containing protein [Phycisphaerales bacterium]|jgi:uncharacterized protein|nr:DUF192 domain-containing protein [Phycisphaerales bacterium]